MTFLNDWESVLSLGAIHPGTSQPWEAATKPRAGGEELCCCVSVPTSPSRIMALTGSWSEPLGCRCAGTWPGLLAPTAALPPSRSLALMAFPGREGSISGQPRLKGIHPWKIICEVARLQPSSAFAGTTSGQWIHRLRQEERQSPGHGIRTACGGKGGRVCGLWVGCWSTQRSMLARGDHWNSSVSHICVYHTPVPKACSSLTPDSLSRVVIANELKHIPSIPLTFFLFLSCFFFFLLIGVYVVCFETDLM